MAPSDSEAFLDLGIAIKSVMMSFGWKQFAFVYSNRKDDLKCSIMKNDLQDAFSVTNDVVITIIIELKKVEQKEVTEALGEVSLRARTIPLPGGKKRSIWESVRTPNDGRDAEAMEAFGETAVISDHMGTGAAPDNYDEFSKEVIARMREPPFYCVDDCQGEEYSYAAAYAGQLYDGVYAYARALNSTLKKNATALRNGTAIMENIEMTFDVTHNVVIGVVLARFTIIIYQFCLYELHAKSEKIESVEGSNCGKALLAL
uniref:ANF_receptor domain-containing protein n=1 Tax=Angiostrongylus cantonensis TaxID=6313 RepID=A0A158P9Z1_ANGCA